MLETCHACYPFHAAQLVDALVFAGVLQPFDALITLSVQAVSQLPKRTFSVP